jgi:glutamine synthetase
VLPPLPLHGGDRNRTSPFAFTGNKFEFRAVGSTASVALPNTVLNTIVAEAIDDLAGQLQEALNGGASLEDALRPVLQKSWAAHKRIVFDGDGYSEAWHKEAEEQRGLLNLRTTPDALPYLVKPDVVSVFSKYEVLNERELHARYEVFTEQYAVRLNIEAETAASIARTMLLPAALRHLALLREAEVGDLIRESEELVGAFVEKVHALEAANLADNQPDDEAEAWAAYMRDTVVPAMNGVREVADKLEKIVADDLWPLPKYSEILFIK